MLQRVQDQRGLWLGLGIAVGLCLAYAWPHEQAQAVGSDRAAQFGMATGQVQLADPIEAIWVLDHLTGSLKGAVLNRQSAKFTSFYYRNLPADFQLDPKKQAQWSMVTGQCILPGQGALAPAASMVYIGEMTSGKVNAYAFGWRETPRPSAPLPLTLVASFPFREPEVSD